MSAARVAVVGAGAAGLSAAFAAVQSGAEVVVLDCEDGLSSNLAIGGGLIAAAGTPAQAAVGIDDSPALWRQDIAAVTDGELPAPLLRAVTEGAAPALARLEAVTDERFAVVQGVAFTGHSRPRLHDLGGRGGPALAALLLERAAATPGISVRLDTPVEGLLVAGGTVRGLTADGGELAADAVILASGGFGGAPDLIACHIPALAGAVHIGSPTNRGDALRWAQGLGVEGLFLQGYQGHGHATVDGLGRLGAGLTSVGAMLVDGRGHRFVREDIGPSALAARVLACDGGRAVEIWSEPMHVAFQRFAAYRDCVARGAVRCFPSADALAQATGLDPDALGRSLAVFNASAAGAADDPLGRVSRGAPLEPPYWAAVVTGALAHTQGGLPVDPRARVLRPDGQPVPGLLAAGGAALGLTGSNPDAYLSGNGLGHAVALGDIAGRTAAGATEGGA